MRGFWDCGAGAASRAAWPTLVRGRGGRRRREPAAITHWKSALLTKSGLVDREPTPSRHAHMHKGARNAPCQVRPPSFLPLFVLRLYGRSRGPDMPWGGRGRGRLSSPQPVPTRRSDHVAVNHRHLSRCLLPPLLLLLLLLLLPPSPPRPPHGVWARTWKRATPTRTKYATACTQLRRPIRIPAMCCAWTLCTGWCTTRTAPSGW